MLPAERLARRDELVPERRPEVPQQASRHATRRLEAQQKSMVMLAVPMQAQQAARVLRRPELPQAAALLRELWLLAAPRPAAQRRALRQPVWSALL